MEECSAFHRIGQWEYPHETLLFQRAYGATSKTTACVRHNQMTTTKPNDGMTPMIRNALPSTARPSILALAAVAIVAAPTAAQKATYVEDFGAMSGKFTALAEAMPSSTYGWRPMDGVRSVSEVYMLIVAEAYYLPSFWDGAPPEGMEINNQIFADLSAVTDKAEVAEHLAASLAYAAAALEGLPEDRLEAVIPFFGQERTIDEAIYLLLVDMHEHLGQAIAYARSNEVVPPWSAGG